MVRGHYSKDEQHKLAVEYDIPLTYQIDAIEPGWLGKPKGLLQVLWERGWIDVNKLGLYSEKGRANQLDGDGHIKKEFEAYVLRTLMSNCQDFVEEKSAMQVLLDDLSSTGSLKIELPISPKYHCELAGEGIEYTWGMLKKYYRSLLLEMKNMKKKFKECVRQSALYIKQKNVKKISAKCRRQMMAYHECDHHKTKIVLNQRHIKRQIGLLRRVSVTRMRYR